MAAVHIPCSACLGHGEVELPEPYREPLVRLTGKWASADAVLRRHREGFGRTALVNRLNALVRWGLLERRGNRRGVEWRRI